MAPAENATSVNSLYDGQKNGVYPVVIVGGGFGGLATAVALRRRGIEVQVYEKSPPGEGRGAGTMIGLAPNGYWALSECEPALVPMVRANGVPSPTSVSLTPEGQVLAKNTEMASMESKYGFPSVAIRWRKVLDLLADLLPPDAVHSDHKLVSIQQDDDHVTAVFETPTGSKEIKAQVLVGADGVRSQVRNSVFGYQEPRDNGRGVWRSIIPLDRVSHPDVKPGHAMIVIGQGRTCTICDCGHNGLYWAYTVTDEWKGAENKERSKDAEATKQRLLADFQGWDLACQILQATEPEEILERRVLDLPVMDEWVKGRVVLMGGKPP